MALSYFKKCFLLLLFVALTGFTFSVDWGFYGHRKINRMAVFTLPQELLGFYKKNIEYITAHAVDPDKRRYALKNEFARHYIDIDHWDTLPFNNIPKHLNEATMKYGGLLAIQDLDTITVDLPEYLKKDFYNRFIFEDRYSTTVPLEIDSLVLYNDTLRYLNDYSEAYFDNALVQYGILPYFLEEFYKRLVRAFYNQDTEMVLKISADIGHYISDGHVPLHTTENYNGQLTNQVGIHAFWESRLPELYADETYDFIVGKAEYIPDMKNYIWNFIEESHALLAQVLEVELMLKESFPKDQQFCFEERLEVTTRIQCEDFSRAYHEGLDGMVEQRMQDAVHAVGSFWYSAWIEAGQPNLDRAKDIQSSEEEQKALDNAFNSGNIYGRKHN